MEFINEMIEYLSFAIGIVGVVIIVFGAIKALFEHIFITEKHIQEVRLTLSSHLVLGLDFMVGKDVIDTMLLVNDGVFFWREIAALVVVVIVRIILTIIMEREIETIRKRKKETDT